MPNHRPLPPLEDLQQKLSYDPETGEFHWLYSKKGIKKGTKAGCLARSGYWLIRTGKVLYKAHRLAWLLHHGVDPGEHEVDHINCNRSDNRACNLRLATVHENRWNALLFSTNTSGTKGVYLKQRDGVWVAEIIAQGKHHYLGRFRDKEDAAAAVAEARKRLHGEFARG